MELRQVRYAIKLAEEMHFGRAAAAMHIAQSAFSVQISRLEQELGVQLFERTPRSVKLTPAGRYFIERSEAMLSGLDRVASEVRAMASPERVLRVGTFGEAAGELTPYIFQSYLRMRPDVTLEFTELTMTDQLERLAHDEVDVAIVRAPLRDEGVRFTPIFAEPRVLACSLSHRFASASSLSAHDVVDEPFAIAGPDVPGEWSSYWALDDVRGGPARTGANVRSVGEAFMAVSNLGVVDTMPSSTSRLFRGSGIAFVPLRDASMSTLTVAARTTERREHVLQFTEAALQARDEHLHVVAGAEAHDLVA